MKFQIVYQVKYSELWCADECSWIEHDVIVEAKTKLEARKLVRKKLDEMPRLIRGKHINTKNIIFSGELWIKCINITSI